MTNSPESQSRYVVGIDLGTTNSAVTYVDSEESPWRIRTFEIPQVVAAGQWEPQETLPSFHYEPAAEEFTGDALPLPWSTRNGDENNSVVGVFAREQGRQKPGRGIASAKSWLCHTGVDRTADLLPWQGADDVSQLSPVEVSARYLTHIRRAWDHHFADHPLAEQDVVLTLPASFDEVARELTVQAGRKAGLPRLVLIEEPQAAFYAWIDAHRDDWEENVTPAHAKSESAATRNILVCDIGGGTSDFTLIRVRKGEEGKVVFHRVAVGEHLILGGDNLDLTLAHHLEEKLTGDGKLAPRQWSVLVQSCRQAKEELLRENAPEKTTVHLPGSGSRLIGGGLQFDVTRDEARSLLVDGFLPQVALDALPVAHQSGFQEFGLPYAADAGITRYLAAFLSTHREVTVGDEELPSDHDPARPDVVLLNGGFFASPVLRERLLCVLSSWFQTEADSDWQPLVLKNERLDMAVARGASYYGMVRRGEGVRIAAGLARTYYVGVESDAGRSAVCLLSAGTEPGRDVEIADPPFTLRVSEPAEFPLYVSSTRLTDKPGELLPVDAEQMKSLPPLRTVLKTRKRGDTQTVSVRLHAKLTEIGTLELWCRAVDGSRSWQLLFDVRSATQTDIAAHESAAEQLGVLDDEAWAECRSQLEATFGPQGEGKPGGLPKRIAKAISLSRSEWPPSLLRNIWETLVDLEDGRRRSPEHEARWLNLLGFALRPGYGFALDDWRVAETWKLVRGKLAHASPTCRAEAWVLWRRVGGGLTSGQQIALASPLLATIRQTHKQMTTGRGKGGSGVSSNSHEAAEIWRTLGSFELLGRRTRVELGGMLADLLPRPKMQTVRPALAWALGRVGTRVPVYGPLNTVVPATDAVQWLTQLISIDDNEPAVALAVMQMARRTGDRYRDIDDDTRDRVLGWLDRQEAPAHFLQLVETGGELEQEEQSLIFGESLPAGLRIG